LHIKARQTLSLEKMSAENIESLSCKNCKDDNQDKCAEHTVIS